MKALARIVAGVVPALALIIGLCPPTDADTAVRGRAGQAMHAYMSRLVDHGFHGAVLVAQGGDVVLHHAYGVRDPRTGAPNTTSTLFSTGSVTKQFTAAAIMKLASEGKLTVEDPVTEYFDGVPEDKRTITLHHMLTHTAGLHPSYGPDSESVARDDLVALVFAEPLMNPVGATYEYSNAGFTLLAVIVEKVTGMKYEEYLREQMYLPNGMQNTGLTSLDVTDDMVARSHNAARDYQSPADRPSDAWHLYGNGGQLTTPADMYRWYLALKEDRLFPREFKERMFTRHTPEGPEGDCHYGYGWSICDTRRGGDLIWHNGGSMGLWSCAVYQYVDDDAVFIVFANTTMDGQPPVDHIAVNLSRILFDEPVEMPPDVSAAPDVDAANFAGVYELAEGEALVVIADGNTVSIAPSGQRSMMAVFPSQMNPMLPKYNGKTEKMLEALRAGDFEGAGADVGMEPNSELTGAEWLRRWWESHDAPESLGRIEVIGTRFGDGAETYARLHFARGVVEYCFHWMMGLCHGISTDAPPVRTLRASSPTRFTAFSLDGGSCVADFSTGGKLILEFGEERLEGTLRD